MALTKTIFNSNISKIKANPSCLSRFRSFSTAKDQLEGSVASYYGKNANYAGLFGTNIHFGYFPHITDPLQPKLTFAESGSELTQHMMRVSGIDSNSKVIDFGCGAGEPIFDVSQIANCQVTGLDLTPEYIEQAKEQFGAQSDKIEYVVGSMTNLPAQIKEGPKFSHLFSIQAICHIARYFDDVLREAHSVLDKDGIMVINDFVVAEAGPTPKAEAHFYKRLHFDSLLTFADFAEGLTRNGFEILRFENCSKHAMYGYDVLAPQAQELGSIEADGLPLSTHYKETSECFERGELGMIVVVARKQ